MPRPRSPRLAARNYLSQRAAHDQPPANLRDHITCTIVKLPLGKSVGAIMIRSGLYALSVELHNGIKGGDNGVVVLRDGP
jgi:hypothetical protein